MFHYFFSLLQEHLVTEKKEKPQSMNAFALISQSAGFNLGNLFEQQTVCIYTICLPLHNITSCLLLFSCCFLLRKAVYSFIWSVILDQISVLIGGHTRRNIVTLRNNLLTRCMWTWGKRWTRDIWLAYSEFWKCSIQMSVWKFLFSLTSNGLFDCDFMCF